MHCQVVVTLGYAKAVGVQYCLLFRVPDPETFEEAGRAPCPDQQELFEELEKAGAIQVSIPDEAKAILSDPPVDKT